MNLRVKMYPRSEDFNKHESGIRRVIEAYEKYVPNYGIEFVHKDSKNFDLIVGHAGAYATPDVLMCHGLYWTADYAPSSFEWSTNSEVITAARHAFKIAVPSSWVAEPFRRDMRASPVVIPHGIDWENWQHNLPNEGYALFNKNRTYDVCNPEAVNILANMFPDIWFVATFANTGGDEKNIKRIGLIPHDKMKTTVQRAGVYLSTVKETFGIGVLEAMAAGIPVLGFEYGGNIDLVKHGINGFLAKPGDYEGLAEGLRYCMKYRSILGKNGQEMVKKYTWENATRQVAELWKSAYAEKSRVYHPKVTVVIPTYNYATKVGRAIDSVMAQTYTDLECIIVDNNSTDNTAEVVQEKIAHDSRFIYVNCMDQGVAYARNRGVDMASGQYYCCLDADDAIDPKFLETCVPVIDKDRSLGIVYTRLRYIKPDGSTGVSPWPGDFDYDAQLKRHNQVPTCHVGRVDMWKRLGGQKQRYAPGGAGAEDAEFILRAGAFGWNMRKVTDEPLFIYSWMSGRVSGDPNYHETDWLGIHPWVSDNQHPFASIATPANKKSHPVRQYDEPVVSVVIPVGPGHVKFIEDALDSIESQTFRKWEVIVVLDCDYDPDQMDRYKEAYPFVRWVDEPGKKGRGAGFARNAGVKIARGQAIFFLDCDDAIYPHTLQTLLDEYMTDPGIIYSDYVGIAEITEELRNESKAKGRLLSYNPKTNLSILSYKSAEYDCERAIRQPDPSNHFIWNLTSSLLPREWHNEIGGFDESMPSWEDWDYWIRMARAGKCFRRIPQPLVMYRFHSGTRRESGLHDYKNLIEYLLNKYKGKPVMPCSTCPGRSGRAPAPAIYTPAQTPNLEASKMSDDNYVLVSYNHPNLGAHKVVGPVSGVNYGYRNGGGKDKMYVDKRDVAARPDVFVAVIEQPVQQKTVTPPPPIPSPLVPTAATEDTDLQKIPGVTQTIMVQLNATGRNTVGDLQEMTEEQWLSLKGIGATRAKIIMDYLSKL